MEENNVKEVEFEEVGAETEVVEQEETTVAVVERERSWIGKLADKYEDLRDDPKTGKYVKGVKTAGKIIGFGTLAYIGYKKFGKRPDEDQYLEDTSASDETWIEAEANVIESEDFGDSYTEDSVVSETGSEEV